MGLLTSCDKLDISGMFKPASTDVLSRVAESLYWNSKHDEVELHAPSDNYRFYVCADIHADSYPYRFAEMARRERLDTLSLFYLALGDLVHDSNALQYIADIMPLNPEDHPTTDTAFAIVGNHDLFYNGWYRYRDLFHTSTYCFYVRTPNYTDLFIMLDSGSGTLGDTQTQWLQHLLADVRPGCRHCIVCMHHNLFKTDHTQTISGNMPLEETYSIMGMLSKYNVDLLLQGHDHFRDVLRFNNVDYITLDDLKETTSHASYLTVDIGSAIGYTFTNMGDFCPEELP